MLSDINLNYSWMYRTLYDSVPTRLERGVYTNTNHNIHLFVDNNYSDGSGLLGFGEDQVPRYAVCDSVEQFLTKYKQKLEASDTKFVIGFHRIDKVNQPKKGGWRWRKWGPYIGTQVPTAEYLADEPIIASVYTVNVEVVT
jgi:hypothetical protein